MVIGQSRRALLRPSRRFDTRGQDLTEFIILVTFFLIVFFCIIQVSLTAIEKFHLNHYAAYSARVWSVCPCTSSNASAQVNEALVRVKLAEGAKKLATGRRVTPSDLWRITYLWGATSNSLGFVWSNNVTGLKPVWAGSEEGPVYFQPIPITMPYANLVMGGSFNVPLPGLTGFLSKGFQVPLYGTITIGDLLNMIGVNVPTSINIGLPKLPDPSTGQMMKINLGYTFVPMDREPMPSSSDLQNYDNDGYPNGGSIPNHRRSLQWTDLVDLGPLS